MKLALPKLVSNISLIGKNFPYIRKIEIQKVLSYIIPEMELKNLQIFEIW